MIQSNWSYKIRINLRVITQRNTQKVPILSHDQSPFSMRLGIQSGKFYMQYKPERKRIRFGLYVSLLSPAN